MNEAQAVDVLNKLNDINAQDRAGKQALLKEFLEIPIFAKVVQYALDTSKTFKVSRVKETDPIEGDIFEFLDELNLKPAATARDKTYLAGLASQSPAQLEVTNRILRGCLDAGFSVGTVMEVAPDLVPYSPYCRCSGYEKIRNIDFSKGPAYSQLKADGMFMNIRTVPEGVVFTTRQGNFLRFNGWLDWRFEYVLPGKVLMGEGLVLDDCGVVMPRAEGNAIISKAIHGQISKEECDRIRFELWDCISLEEFEKGISGSPYQQRFRELSDMTSLNFYNLIETEIVNSMEEAWDHYVRVRETGKEGTVLKDPRATWFDGTSARQIKLKAEKSCEVLVTGWNPGKPGSKYEKCIGSLIVQSSCGKLVGDVSGLTDEQRSRDPESFIGRVITVKFNAVSKSKKTDIRSFDHARIDGDLRHDKTKADDLEYILKVKEAKRR